MELIRSLSMAVATALALSGCMTPQNTTTEEAASAVPPAASATTEDPYLWLEEVEGDRALNWVRNQNQRTLSDLQANPIYADLNEQALEVVNSSERIPYGTIRNGYVYNFWQDATNIRGLWRRTTLESYTTNSPQWETILDFDKLAESEGKNWVYKGANCYTAKAKADYKCLISLSNGGKDAVVIREFDLTSKSFVNDGFTLPEAKSGVTWVDYNTLLVATDWGGDGSTLTDSRYPSVVKRWQRGTSLSDATTLFSGNKTDVGVWPFTQERDDGTRLEGVVVAPTFFTSEYYIFPSDDEAIRLPLPEKTDIEGWFEGQLIFTIKQDWTVELLECLMV